MAHTIRQAGGPIKADEPLGWSRLLGIPALAVHAVEYDEWQGGIILCCTHTQALAICPRCDHSSGQVHQVRPRRVRDLPWCGERCWLEFPQRRFKCRWCRRPFTEVLPEIAPYARYTRRYGEAVLARCDGTTLRAVSQQEQVGYKTVEALYYRQAAAYDPYATDQAITCLGIDEIALKKGQGQYALVISDGRRKCVLAILPERTKEALVAYFATWSAAQRAAITEVALDLWEPYHLAVAACLPNAQVVGDRFHVMKQLNDRVTAVRRTLQRTATEEQKAALKGSRWLLVRNQADLTPTQQAHLDQVLAQVPTLRQVHTLKEAFRTICDTAPDRASAAAQLTAWIAEAEASGNTLTAFIKTLRAWWACILNYFIRRLTSGFVEGLNNKLKLVKRRAFGYRRFEHFRLRALRECRGHP